MAENPFEHNYVRYHGEDKDALYVDGELVIYDDAYLVDEYLANLLNVNSSGDEDFLLGTDDEPAKTLDEIAEFKKREA